MQKEHIIAVFGDSIAHGVYFTPGFGWPDLLKSELQCDEPELWRLIFNLSMPGETAAGVLGRFEVESGTRDVTHAVFAIGINDSKRSKETGMPIVELPEFERQIRRLLELAAGRGMQATLIGLTPIFPNRLETEHSIFESGRIADFDAALQRIAAETGILYISVRDCVDSNELPDGLHPDAAAQQKICDRVATELARAGFLD